MEVIDGELTGKTFHTYLHTDETAPPNGLDIYGLGNEFSRGQPRFESIHATLEVFLSNAHVFIHSAKLYLPFLEAEFERSGTTLAQSVMNLVHDTLPIFRSIFPTGQHDLESLCTRLAIPTETTTHTTLSNARSLALIFRRIHTVAMLACPPVSDVDPKQFLRLIQSIEDAPNLPTEFGIAYLQRNLKIGYKCAILLMNQLCHLGLIEWSIHKDGQLIFQRIRRSL